MTSLVLDASAIVDMVLETNRGRRVERQLSEHRSRPQVPEICPVEVLAALRGLVLGRQLSAERAAFAADDLTRLGLKRHTAMPMLSRIWQLRDNLTAYDASYVALAERLDATLITVDRKLDTPAVRRLIAVEVID